MSKLPLFVSTTEEENYLLKSELRSYKQSHGLMQNQITQLESQLQAAQAKIKELEQAQEWVGVDEKPKQGQRVLVCYLPNAKTTNSVTGESIEYGFTDYCYRDDFPFMYGDYKISHWLPLPPQPKGE